MPKPTYKEVWKRAKNLGKENYELKKTVAIFIVRQNEKRQNFKEKKHYATLHLW